jgi:hypothetical protein
MANVDVTTPGKDQIAALFDPMLEAVREVADNAWQIIKDKAILDNEDVNGQQMPPKVPRPKNNPQNFPNLPLIQDTDPDLMNNDRFTVEHTDEGADLVFDPPVHNDYLLDKPQVEGGGGRHWIGRVGTINPNARAEIEEMIRRKLADIMGG